MIDKYSNYGSENNQGSEEEFRKELLKNQVRTPYEKKKKDATEGNYTQDFVPIEAIVNGVVKTTDGRYVKILQIEPINFSDRSNTEKNNIILHFASLFKLAEIYTMQVKILTKSASPDKYLEIIDGDMKFEKNEQVVEMMHDHIEMIENLTLSQALTREFFLIFEARQSDFIGINKTEADIIFDLNILAQTVAGVLSNTENIARTYRTISDEEREIYNLYYRLFNRKTSNYETLENRIDRVFTDQLKALDISESQDYSQVEIDVADILAPRGLDLSYSKYFVMDGVYHTVLYIDGSHDSYPSRVVAGWVMDVIMGFGEGVDVDIFFERREKSTIKKKIDRTVGDRRSSFNRKLQQGIPADEEKRVIEAGVSLADSLNEKEDFFDMSILITVTSNTKRDLFRRVNIIRRALETEDFKAQICTLRQKDALLSTLPLAKIQPSIQKQSRRNVTTMIAASTYPFSAFEIADDNGVVVGLNQTNNSLCVLDIFDDKKYKNANGVLIGTTGAGKTFTLQVLASRLRYKNIQTFILAPIKGHEFSRLTKALGGTHIRLSTSSSHCINIFEIRPMKESDSDFLDKILGGSEERSLLGEKLQQLVGFFSLLIPNMTPAQESIVDEASVRVYKRFGITHDNNSIFVNNDPEGSLKTMPIFSDFHDVVKEIGDARQNKDEVEVILDSMQPFITGTYSVFNQQTNVDLDNQYTILDISGLEGKYLPIGMYIAFDFAWDKIKEDRTKRKVFIIDEVWKLLSESEKAAEQVMKVYKLIRAYGGSVISATQNIGDFLKINDGAYGEPIIFNSMFKIILQLEKKEVQSMQKDFGFTDFEIDRISKFPQGSALLIANNNKVPIAIRASDREEVMITTSPKRLQQLAHSLKIDISDYIEGDLPEDYFNQE